MKKESVNKIFLVFFGIVLIAFSVYEVVIGNSYIWDSLVLIFLLLLAFYHRNKINLSPSHFFFFGLFLVLHNCGVFGFYDMHFFGIEFDYYVHTYFGLVIGLVLFRAYDKIVPLKNDKVKYFLIIVFVLGLSAFHEILEYLGGAYLGEGMGFLKAGPSDIEMWDTQLDMRNNLIGSFFALSYYWFKRKFSKNSILIK